MKPVFSIRQRLAASATILVLIVVAVISAAAYREVRRSAILAASQRAENVSRQLSDLFAVSGRQLLDQVRALSRDSGVATFLRNRTAEESRVTLATLARTAKLGDGLAAVELWDQAGQRLLTTNDSIAPVVPAETARLMPAATASDAGVIGWIGGPAGNLGYSVVAAVKANATTVGFVVERRRIARSSQASNQLKDLIGVGTSLFVGNVRGDVWTDLIDVAAPPPISIADVKGVVRYERPGGRVLSAIAKIPNTPWALAIEIPLALTLSPAHAMLWRLALFTAVLLIAAAAGAWVISGTLTRSIGTLVAAAGRMSAGDLAQPIPVERRDELGVLGIAFNRMAERISQSRFALESNVAELQDAEARYHTLFDANPQPTWVFDVETLAFLDVNAAAVRRYGYSRDEFLTLTILDIRPAEDAPAVLATLASIVKTHVEGRTESIVSRHRTKDGMVFDIESHSSSLMFGGRAARLVVVTDLTERRRAEESLRAAQERLERVIGSSGAVLYELRLESSGPVLDWISHNVTSILGYELADLIDADWWSNNVHPEDRKRLGNGPERVSYHDGASEYRFRHKGGKYRWLREEQRVVAIPGEASKVIGAWLDITDQRQLEDRLRQSQKMEAMGTLAGGVAHDFNNMLTVVNGYSQMLLATVGDNPVARPMIDEIANATERATALTQQLLSFSRGRVIESRAMDLGGVVRATQSMLSRLISEDIELTFRMEESPLTVLADAGQLTQVVMNLVVNARDAMPSGGRLVVETSMVELKEAYDTQYNAAIPGQYAVITVTDTGIGMDSETQSRIFEPFFTTKGEGQGTGLGLSTVFGIVKQLGGGIWVYSEPGRGTTFKVYIPRTDGVIHEPVAASASLATNAVPALATLAPPHERRATVLIVEDDAMVRSVARILLERAGYTIVEAVNGLKALELLSTMSVDVVVTDTVMPGMGGLELADRLADERPDLPVVLTSGYTADSLNRHGPMPDLLLFVEKPFTAETLRSVVEEALRRAVVSRVGSGNHDVG